MDIKLQKKYLIETPNGFKQFDGISKNKKECYKIVLNNNNYIKCSIDHPFIINDKIIKANKLSIGDFLETKNGKCKIIKIINIGKKYCYDLLNVDNNHIFYANDILTHNSFLGSSETLIKGEKIKQIKDEFVNNKIKSYHIQLHPDFKNTKVNIYESPKKGHAYIIGADPSMGAESDYHSIIVYDITNAFKIKQVVGFYENNINPKAVAYMIAKLGLLYNFAFVAIENNGVSQVVLDALWRDFDYDNIIHLGGNPKTNIGIHSNNERKTEACLNFKELIEDQMRTITFNDGRIINEMEKFERKSRLGKLPTYEAADGHDDYMMAAIWGLYPIKFNILENYYDIRKSFYNKLNEEIALYILPFESQYTNKQKQFLEDLDKKFNLFNNEYEKKLSSIKNNIDSEKDEIDNFIKENGLFVNNQNEIITEKKDDNDDEFRFRLFTQ